MHLEHIERCIL